MDRTRLFPARAGMNRLMVPDFRARTSVPRTRGDEPIDGAGFSGVDVARPGRWVTVWTGDMGNSFCSSAYRLSSSSCRLGSAEAATLIDRSECHRPVPDRPDAVVLFGQADRFASQAFADIEGPALPPDLAAMAHPADLPVGGVVRRAQPAAVGPGGGLVMQGRRGLPQRAATPGPHYALPAVTKPRSVAAIFQPSVRPD